MSRPLPAVLVLSGGGFQGLALVRLLSESDAFRIVVADTYDTGVTAPFVDRFVRIPPVAERRAFEEALGGLCQAEDVRLVLPSTDHELEALAGAAPVLEAEGVTVAVCEAPLLARLRNKETLYEDLAAAGLPVLAPVPLREGPLPLPLIGKPRLGWGSRGVVVARVRVEIDQLPASERASRVWQPFLEGADEISADFAVSRDGAEPEVGLRRRVRTTGGFAVVSDTVRDPEAAHLVRRFASWAGGRGGRGLFNVQLLRRGTLLVLSDVNPRLGTSAAHWRGSGFNPALVPCAEAGLVPASAGGRAPSALLRSVRHLEELLMPAGPPPPAVEGVVFDLDDTLVPTKRWMRDRLGLALDAVATGSERARAHREGCRILEEGPRARLIDALTEALGWGEAQREALLRAYQSTWPGCCAAYPDVKPGLDALRRRGLRLGILTDNPPDTQRRKLEAAGLGPFLDVVVFSQELGAEKPDGRGFARVAEALGVEPAKLAMAGDNPHRDLAGAAEAGYARLFWMRRPWSSSFDPALAEGLPGAERFEPVSDLRQLAARLIPARG